MPCRTFFATLLLVLCAPNAFSQETPPPAVTGYVTQISSPTNFDVNGTHVLCNDKTEFGSKIEASTFISRAPQNHYIGEAVNVYGEFDKKTHTMTASKVVVSPPSSNDRSGIGIIDFLPPSNSSFKSRDFMLRADGYRILITPKTQTTFTSPLTSLTNVKTNVWIKYTGKLRPDGTVVADTATFTANAIPEGEDKLRTKNEYDPKAVDPKNKQSGISKYFLGTNIKKIPPYSDPAMQSRIDRIGASLIPEYQRNLPASDPTKIDFRFQLIDQPKWHDAMTLPNGIILVPRQVVERLQNDSQLATVLADNIACAIEKQTFRVLPKYQTMGAAQLASDAGGIFVPGLGVATGIANYRIAAAILRHTEEQSGRISLFYLHDAGYDIQQAPLAWWLLAPKKPKDIHGIDMPERAAYLYSVIGQTWRNDPVKSQSSGNLLSSTPNP